MKSRLFTILSLGLLLIALASSLAGQTTPACGRACLEGFMDRYLDALVANNASRLPLTKTAMFTENGQRLDLNDGLWNTATGKGTYRLVVPDEEVGQIAFIATIREAGVPTILAARLKVQAQKIAEIETLVVRDERAAENLEKLGQPNARFLEIVPPAERPSRQELIRIANMYFSGIQLNDGKGEYPFADDCNRLENGMQTTNNPNMVPPPPEAVGGRPQSAQQPRQESYSPAWSCKKQFESGLLHFVTRVRDRRFVAVDREHGVVFAFGFFDHAAGKTRTFQTPDGRTVTAGPVVPWTWEIAELFKIDKGKIRQIEAVLNHSEYGMGSGWSTWEDAMSSRAR
jgi:hypothetical protein